MGSAYHSRFCILGIFNKTRKFLLADQFFLCNGLFAHWERVLHMTDFLAEFETHLNAQGYVPVRPLRVGTSTWLPLIFEGEKRSQASGGCKIIENDDGSLFANFGSRKDALGFRHWHSGGGQELNIADRARLKTARADLRRCQLAAEKARHEKIGRLLTKVFRGLPPAPADHPYLADKGVGAHCARLRAKGNELIIPRYDIKTGNLMSVQRIIQKKRGVRSVKLYFAGALARGLYCPLADKNDDKSIVVICEGFATGAAIRVATGLPVMAAFDTEGVKNVAPLAAKKYPKSRLFIAADNDQWTRAAGAAAKVVDKAIASGNAVWSEWRESGLLYNAGMEAAKKAALKCGGAVILAPPFAAGDALKGTDWNDYLLRYGADAVKRAFNEIKEIPPSADEAAGAGISANPSADVQTPARSGTDDSPVEIGEKYEEMDAGFAEPERLAATGDLGMPFRVLGYNEGTYYYYPFGMKQIVALTAAGHSMQNLLQLAPLEKWEAPWRDGGGKLGANHATIALSAFAAMSELAVTRGVFAEENSVRGAGAWIDEGRVVLHCGDTLFVDGAYMDFSALSTKFTYTAAKRHAHPSREPLDNYHADMLRKICESATWENKLSGSLLAGWLVIAPICAALEYRPHIYLTGESDSGKSTILDKIIKPVVGNMALCVDGDTSEPSIRQSMGRNGQALIFDEGEGSANMPAVIRLARLASTGAIIKKFGQKPFNARFAACFSAVNPPVSDIADESRISFMVLKKNRKPTAIQDFDDILALIDEFITDDIAERLLARTLANMQALIANIRIFQREARAATTQARASRQIGTLLAGLYLLGRTGVVTDKEAREYVLKHDWSDHTTISDIGDPARLVQHIAGSIVRNYKTGGDVTIGELIYQNETLPDSATDKILRQYGIAIKGRQVLIASRSQNLARLLKGTDWNERWSRTLSDVAGAEKIGSAYFSRGVRTSAVALPIELFLDEEPRAGSLV
jgi:putative DNA primase/helicase